MNGARIPLRFNIISIHKAAQFRPIPPNSAVFPRTQNGPNEQSEESIIIRGFFINAAKRRPVYPLYLSKYPNAVYCCEATGAEPIPSARLIPEESTPQHAHPKTQYSLYRNTAVSAENHKEADKILPDNFQYD